MGTRRKSSLDIAVIYVILCSVGCRSTNPGDRQMNTQSTRPVAAGVAREHVVLVAKSRTEASVDGAVSKDNAQSEVVQASAAIEAASSIQIVEESRDAASKSIGNQGSDLQNLDTQSIDLTTALQLTTGRNPQIAFARARFEESLAQIDRANALKLPSIRGGVNYNKHEGRIQDVAGRVIETSRGSFYSGLGAQAVGAGSPLLPGIVSQFHFTDAIFQPRIAQRTACARQAGAEATTNDLLLATAIAYMELLRTEQDLAIAKDIVQRSEKLSATTEKFAIVGQGLESDYDRARTEVSLRKNDLIRAEELAAVASSRLAELVRWDAGQRLVPSEAQLTPIQLSDRNASPRELVSMALTKRPELAESRHLVGEAVERLNRERNAPLIPSVLLAASYGGLGGGLGSSLSTYGDRLDADAVAYWEVRQLGVGENAIRREAKSKIAQARMREIATMDRIAREVSESLAQVASRSRQIPVIEEAIDAAEKSFTKNWDRIQNGQGLPIEVLQSIQALALSQREYVKVVADYNIAQFTLQRALGWPIDGLENLEIGE